MSDKYITVDANGVIEVHAHGATCDYATLCGLDGNDPNYAVAQKVIATPDGAKINCPDCVAIIRMARRYTKADIANNMKEMMK